MKYSIITCTYNASSFLAGYFKIIDGIDYEDFEIVIVDDASTDSTYEVLQENAGLSAARVIMTRHQFNSGPGVARNTALKMASGDRILFLDVDDELDKDIFRTLDSISGYDIVFFDYNKKYSSSALKRQSSLPLPSGEINDIEKVMQTTTGSVWGKVFVSSVIKKHDISFPDIYKTEDLVFVLTYLSYCNSVYYLKRPLYSYLISPSSLVHRNIEDQVGYAYKAIKIISQLPISDDVKAAHYCREIVYDLTNIYITLGRDRRFLMQFWRENPLPRGWRRLKRSMRGGHYLSLFMIAFNCYYPLKFIGRLKSLIG